MHINSVFSCLLILIYIYKFIAYNSYVCYVLQFAREDYLTPERYLFSVLMSGTDLFFY